MIEAGDNEEEAAANLDRFLSKMSKKLSESLYSIIRVLINILNKTSDSTESKIDFLSSIKILCEILILSIDNSSLEKAIHRLENFFDFDFRSFNKHHNMKHISVCTTESLTLNSTNKNETPRFNHAQNAETPVPPIAPPPPPPPAPPPTSLFAKLANVLTGKKSSAVKISSDTPPKIDRSKILNFDHLPKPSRKLRPIFWQKIAADKIAVVADSRNVWTPTVEKFPINLDFEILDDLFEAREIDTEKRAATTAECATSSRKRRDAGALTLFGSRRSLNINIFLNKENVQELLDSIAFGDSGRLGVDKLESLLKLLPDSEEVEFLTSQCTDLHRLAQAEQFILQLIALDNYKLRIESMLLKEDFDSTINRIKSSLNVLSSTAEGILDCKRLKEILHFILTIGNYINSGTEIGGAAGFRLSSLLKIVELRSTKKNNLTLMHHLISILERANPALLDFSHDLMFLEEAASKDINDISIDFKHLKSKVELMSSQISQINGDFGVQMTIFLNYAKRELTSIEQQLSRVEILRQKLAEYFCDNFDQQTFKTRDCLKILRDFKRRFSKAHQDVKETKSQKHKLEILSIQSREAPPSYASPFVSRRLPPNLAAQIFGDEILEKTAENQSQISILNSILIGENRPFKNAKLTLPGSDEQNCRRRSSSSAFRRQESRERDLLVPKCRPSTSRETPSFLVENCEIKSAQNSPVEVCKMDFLTARMKFNEKKTANFKRQAFDRQSLTENSGAESAESVALPSLSEIPRENFVASDDSSSIPSSVVESASAPTVRVTGCGQLLPPGPRRRPSATSSSSSATSSSPPSTRRCRCDPTTTQSRDSTNSKKPATSARYKELDRNEGFETAGSVQSRRDRNSAPRIRNLAPKIQGLAPKIQNREPAPKRKTVSRKVDREIVENSTTTKKTTENYRQKSSIREQKSSNKSLSPATTVTADRDEGTTIAKKKMDKKFQRLKSPVSAAAVKSGGNSQSSSSSIATRKPWR